MRKPFAIAALTLLVSTAFAAGEVYRWKDASGLWHYSDQNHPGAELVVRGQAVPADATTNAAAPAPAAAPPPPAAIDPLPVSKEVAQEVRQEVAAAKAKACEKAKAEYDQAVRAQKMVTKDAKGNVTFLDAAAMDKARLNARANKDTACGT